MPKIFAVLDKVKPVYDIIDETTLLICKALLAIDILITAYAVAGRSLHDYIPFLKDPGWSEEIVLTFLSYLAGLSAALLIRKGTLLRITAFDALLPKKIRQALDLLADAAGVLLGVILLRSGWNYANTLGARGVYASLPWLSRFWMYFPIPVNGATIILFEVESIYDHVKVFFMRDEEQPECAPE